MSCDAQPLAALMLSPRAGARLFCCCGNVATCLYRTTSFLSQRPPPLPKPPKPQTTQPTPPRPNPHAHRTHAARSYVTVAPAAGRRLYYYLVNSESKHPDRDPLVIWLTGGPGCSSLDAFTYENGPFRFHIDSDDVTLSRNPYAWSRVAHVLYVDSPAGTGMSYSTDPEVGGW